MQAEIGRKSPGCCRGSRRMISFEATVDVEQRTGVEGVQTHMATAISKSGKLTRLVLCRQQFVSCRPEEEWKNEAVWSMEASAGYETEGEGSPSLWHVCLLGSGLSASIIYQTNDVWHGARTTGESDLTDWSWCYTWLECVSDHRDFSSDPYHINMLPCLCLNAQQRARRIFNYTNVLKCQ